MSNLIGRHIIHPNVQLCVGVCGQVEDMNHLFLSCDFFRKLWYGLYSWFGFTTMHPTQVADHFLQFGSFGGYSKNIRSILLLIRLSCV